MTFHHTALDWCERSARHLWQWAKRNRRELAYIAVGLASFLTVVACVGETDQGIHQQFVGTAPHGATTSPASPATAAGSQAGPDRNEEGP